MTIETKLNPGDEAWFIYDNKVKHNIVRRITVNIEGHSKDGFKNPDKPIVEYTFAGVVYYIGESRVFRSKEELKKSL